jgi:hypothetical protein
MALEHFLLLYDRAAGKVQIRGVFTDAAEAAAAYEQLEREHKNDQNLEIVLVGSDSIETVKLTHGNYFKRGRGIPFPGLIARSART